MYREFVNGYYDIETGPHRMKLLERDFDLSHKHWAVRALFKIGVVILPFLLLSTVGVILHLTA